MDLKEVFEDPQVLAQEMMLEVDHPKMTGFPVKLSETPAKFTALRPSLGRHIVSIGSINRLKKVIDFAGGRQPSPPSLAPL